MSAVAKGMPGGGGQAPGKAKDGAKRKKKTLTIQKEAPSKKAAPKKKPAKKTADSKAEAKGESKADRDSKPSAKSTPADDRGEENGEIAWKEAGEEGEGDDDESDEDYSDDGGDEGEDGYRPGGYHPVNIGERYHTRYTILQKLGWGHFSTVWMVHDKKCKAGPYPTPEFVALKIQKSAPHYRESAIDEIELLKSASDCARSDKVLQEFGPTYDPSVVLLLDHFDHTGPNGTHMCMVFEMLGENLLEVIKKYDYKGIPIDIVRTIAKQICVGLDFLHRHCNIIHTDLKPENLLISRPPTPPPAEVVAGLLSTGGGGPKKKKKKKGGASDGDVNVTIEALTKQLQADVTLNAEQRKKLKKKIKKKKQQAKKKDKKGGKGGTRNRRSDRPGALGENASSLSVEKAQLEMRMMELDSDRIVRTDEEDARAAHAHDHKRTAGDDANGNVDSKIHSDDHRVAGVDAHADAKDTAPLSSQSKDYKLGSVADVDSALDHFGRMNLEEKFSSPGNSGSGNGSFPDPPLDVAIPQSDLLLPDEVMALMPPWLRPTWFSFLNFSGEEYEDAGSPTKSPSHSGGVKKISVAEWVNPTDESYSKLTLLLSTNRMVEAFGRPEGIEGEDDEIDEDDELPFAEWYFAFNANSDATDNAGGTEDTVDGDQFAVRGRGYDKDNLVELVGLTALNSLAYENDKYYIASSDEEGDQPVAWNIVHHSHSTKAVIAYLESAIEGVSFLVHHNSGDSVISEEDDAELLYIMRQLSIHPVCESPESWQLSSDNAMEDEELRGARELNTLGVGKGAVVGIDVLSLSRSIRCATEDPDLPESQRKSYDFTGYVHPLEKRYAYFASDLPAVAQAANTYNRVNLTLLALGEHSGPNSPTAGVDDEAEEKYRDRMRELREEYEGSQVKIVDLGNACWTHKHFTEDIQTRQYRCPEVLLGATYDTSADMWSFACVVFELLTGDLLFDPRAGTKWDREEDHLAMMIELCGDFPRSVTSVGKKCQQYFNKRGDLHHIHQLKYWPLQDVLHDKYRFSKQEAEVIASFLMPCLSVDPAERASALDCLSHPFVRDEL